MSDGRSDPGKWFVIPIILPFAGLCRKIVVSDYKTLIGTVSLEEAVPLKGVITATVYAERVGFSGLAAHRRVVCASGLTIGTGRNGEACAFAESQTGQVTGRNGGACAFTESQTWQVAGQNGGACAFAGNRSGRVSGRKGLYEKESREKESSERNYAKRNHARRDPAGWQACTLAAWQS